MTEDQNELHYNHFTETLPDERDREYGTIIKPQLEGMRHSELPRVPTHSRHSTLGVLGWGWNNGVVAPLMNYRVLYRKEEEK